MTAVPISHVIPTPGYDIPSPIGDYSAYLDPTVTPVQDVKA